MTRLVTTVLIGATLLALPACAQHHASRVADVAPSASLPAFEGNWKSPDGRTARVTRGSTTAFDVTIYDKDSSQSYAADVLTIGGKQFVELLVHNPSNSKTVPVYMYGLLDVHGDDLSYRPLRADWIQNAVKNTQGASYLATSEVKKGSGGFVVHNAKQMDDILTKAANDPTAFGDPETAHRAK